MVTLAGSALCYVVAMLMRIVVALCLLQPVCAEPRSFRWGVPDILSEPRGEISTEEFLAPPSQPLEDVMKACHQRHAAGRGFGVSPTVLGNAPALRLDMRDRDEHQEARRTLLLTRRGSRCALLIFTSQRATPAYDRWVQAVRASFAWNVKKADP